MMTHPTVGLIGHGFVGKSYADEFESRGIPVVRYALEEPYRANKERIAECDIVFIAVPTPTGPDGFDAGIVESAIGLVGVGKTAVIKSTILPGTTKRLQERYPDRIVLFSPEFLSEATAAQDVANPFGSVVGMPTADEAHQASAEAVLRLLPEAPLKRIVSSAEAELFKYAHNGSGYVQILFFNVLYDLAVKLGADWSAIEECVHADPYIPNRYAKPVHKSGRGAGGHCFIKDFAAIRELHESINSQDTAGTTWLRAAEAKNVALLQGSGKDLDLLASVYGSDMPKPAAP
ncbi:MAG: hypothetical protein AAB582_02810 [Patescibacteria group bacterium]